MIVFRFVLFMLFISLHQCRTPDKVFCVDENCSEPISKARSILAYTSADRDLISYKANAEALVYMKSAGTEPDLWFVSIDGRKGFVTSKFFRELRIYKKDAKVIKMVDNTLPMPPDIKPNKVKPVHEVIDGTIIYITESTANSDASTEAPLPASDENTPILGVFPQGNSNKLPQDVPSLALQQEITPVLNENTPQLNGGTPIKTANDNNVLENVNVISVQKNEDNIVPVDQQFVQSTDTNNDASMQLPSAENSLIQGNINKGQQDSISSSESNPGLVMTPEIIHTVSPTTEEVSTEETVNVIDNFVTSTTENSIQQPQPPLQSPILTSGSDNTFMPETVVNIPDTSSNLIPETVIQHVAQESEQNVSTPSMVTPDESNKVPDNEINSIPLNTELNTAQNEVPVTHNNRVFDNSQNMNGVASTPELNQEPVNQTPINESVTQEPINEPVAQEPINEPVTQEPINEPVTQEPINEPVTQEPINKPVNQELTSEPAYHTSTTETIPAFFSQETMNQIDLNIPPSEQHNAAPPSIPTVEQEIHNYNVPPSIQTNEESQPTQETPQNLNMYSTTPSLYEDSSPTLESATEAYNLADTESVPTELPTDAPEEPSAGFLSSLLSTVADIWPSSTESPASDIFNTHSNSEPDVKEKLEEVLDNLREPVNLDHIYHKDSSRVHEKFVTDSNEGFSFLSYFSSLYLMVMGSSVETRALFASPGETCYTKEYPEQSDRSRLLTFLATTAASVVLFSLGYYYIDSSRQDGKYLGMVNTLQRELLCTTKECEILKEELTTTKTKLSGIEDSSFGMDDMVQSLKEEIEELKAQKERLRNSLDDNEKLLRVSENTAGEMQNTLGEVENTLSELLAERAQSEEHIAELNAKLQAFEEEVISVTRDRDSYQLKYVSVEASLDESRRRLRHLDDVSAKLADAADTVELQRHEIVALKEALKGLKSGGLTEVDVASLIDHTEIKAKLAKALGEKTEWESQFKIEHAERSRLQQELQSTQQVLQASSQQAHEATTRLEVLEKYFQEREGELMKELSSKESLYLSKKGESASTIEKIELLQQEVQRYKEKCDALTLELAEQESARRTAVAALESRAHAAWLEARAAKRDAQADKEAAAALRRKLASLSTQPEGTASPHHQRISSPLETSVLDGPLPPLPLAFLPPPPLLPPLPRPPPLGRLPSPHPPPRYNDRHYSPDSRYSPESRYSPGTVRYSPDSRYSPERSRHARYSPRRPRADSRERYTAGSRQRNGPVPETETEYGSDSPSQSPRRRRPYSRHSGSSTASSESDK